MPAPHMIEAVVAVKAAAKVAATAAVGDGRPGCSRSNSYYLCITATTRDPHFGQTDSVSPAITRKCRR